MKFEEGRLDEDFLAIRALVRLPFRVNVFMPYEIGQEIGPMPAIQTHVFLLETVVPGFFHVVFARNGFAFSIPFPGTELCCGPFRSGAEGKRGLQLGRRRTWRNGSRGAFG